MSTREQRRHTRFPVRGIFGSLRSPMDVRVRDLSRAGIGFETPEHLLAGQRCYMELRRRAGAASVEVEVRWTKTVEAAGDRPARSFRVGASFVEVVRDRASGFWAGIRPDPGVRLVAR